MKTDRKHKLHLGPLYVQCITDSTICPILTENIPNLPNYLYKELLRRRETRAKIGTQIDDVATTTPPHAVYSTPPPQPSPTPTRRTSAHKTIKEREGDGRARRSQANLKSLIGRLGDGRTRTTTTINPITFTSLKTYFCHWKMWSS